MKPRRSHGRTNDQWDKMCLRKRRFPDEYVARASAQTTLQSNPDVGQLFVYQCPSCRGWHLTHKNHGEKTTYVTRDNPYRDDRPPIVWNFLALTYEEPDGQQEEERRR